MKRLLPTLFIVLTLFTSTAIMVSIGAPVAHAQTTAPAGGNGLSPVTVTAQMMGTAPVPGTGAGIPNSKDISADTSTQFGTIMTWIMSLFAWLVGVAALTLDWTVYYTVVTMGNYVSHLTAVGLTWRILRDIGNIMLIFGFLAAGIATILNVHMYGWGKQMLPMLLVAAVFLNFSLFISEAVIDVGNLFATQIFTQINGGVAPTQASLSGITIGNFGTTNLGNEGISNKIMAQLGLQTAYGDFNINTAVVKGANPWIIGFMGIILFLVTAFVMFSLALILIARFVVLIFLIIIAPIGFAGLIVPKLENTAKNWWSTLFEQTITAPILLLLLYIALAVITDQQFLTGTSRDWLGFVANTNGTANYSGFANIMLSFLIAMGLLLFVVVAAKRLGAKGADMATKWAGAATFGATAFGLRYTAGLTSNAAARKVRENRLLNRTALGRLAGRRIAGVFDYGATASYHVGAGLAGAGVGVDFGKTHQGGYRAEKKVTDEYKASTEEARRKVGERQRQEELKKAQRAIGEEDQKLAAGMLTQSQYDANIAPHNDTLTKTMAKMSTKELEELDGIKKGTESLVRNLSPQQFEALMKSDKLSVAQQDEIRKKRFKDVNNKIAIAANPGATRAQTDDARTAITKISTKELAHMDKSVLTSNFVADSMTNDQYDALVKDGVLNTTQKAALDARRKDRFDPAVTPAPAVADAIRSLKWNRDQIKKLPAATITDSNVLDSLGLDALNLIDIARTGNLSPTDRQKIGTYFEDVATHPTDPRQADFAAYLAADPRIKRDLLIP